MSAQPELARQVPEELSTHYRQHIAPALARMETRRRQAVKRIIALAVLAGIGLGVMLAGDLIAAATGLDDFIIMAGAFLVMFAALAGAAMIYKQVHARFKQVLVGGICKAMGLEFSPGGFRFAFAPFSETGLVPGHDRRSLEDRIAGEHKGVRFELCEALLKRRVERRDSKGNTRVEYRTVFRGLLMIYEFPKRFQGRTVVVPDATWLGNMIAGLGRKGERVKLEDPRFEHMFEVYSDDQVEARYLLTPTFMERLQRLAENTGQGPRSLAAAFTGSRLLLSVRCGENRFEGGHIFKPFDQPERVERLVEELGIIFEIIDTLDLDNRSRI